METKKTPSKGDRILTAIKTFTELDEFGAAELTDICRFCHRFGITGEEVQRYIASKQASGDLKGEVVGHAFYIIIQNH